MNTDSKYHVGDKITIGGRMFEVYEIVNPRHGICIKPHSDEDIEYVRRVIPGSHRKTKLYKEYGVTSHPLIVHDTHYVSLAPMTNLDAKRRLSHEY